MKDTLMSNYEHVIISRPDISSTQVEEMVKHLGEKLKPLGGKVVTTEYWGLKNLAYRIKKNRKAHYSLLQIEAPSAAMHEIERQHRINEDILRYMSIRVDEFAEGPSPIMAKREERKRRDDSDRR
jgi:small subunit ribosomal protein S6